MTRFARGRANVTSPIDDWAAVAATDVNGEAGSDTVVVTSSEALNSPQQAVVTFVVKSEAKPAIDLRPDSLGFVVVPRDSSDLRPSGGL